MATAPPSADAVLVRRLRERDRSAWEELYAEFGPRLRPFAYRLTGNPHDADDLVQETFVRALPRLDRLDPATVDLGPYLFTTLRNLFYKSVERGKRSESMAEVPEPLVPAPIEDDPERNTLLRNQQEEVRVANARLAPRQRLVLALRELEDRSYAEIGEVVGLKENAVAQLISRARENLRTELRLTQVDPSRLPEECRRFLPLLSRHLDGQLRGAQLEGTLTHLEGCERCQETLLAMREAQRRYRVFVPPFGGGEQHRDRIDAELVSSGWWAGPAKRGALLRGRRALVAATVALLAVGGGGVGAAVLVTKGGRPAAVLVLTGTSAGTSSVQSTLTEEANRTVSTVATTTTAPTSTSKATTTKPTTTEKTTTRTMTSAHKTTTAQIEPASTHPVTTTATKTGPTPVVPKKTATTPHTTTTAPTTTVATTTTVPADTQAPTVMIVTRPPNETTSGSASFSFRASEAGSAFSCRLDDAAFAMCTNPASYHGLAPGGHSFSVRARDAAGNTGAAAVAGWTILPPPDTTPPTATITSAATPGTDATFAFTSSEAGSTFGCSLDGGAFAACRSPRSYTSLAVGRHTFAVRATDAAGNTGGAAQHLWSVARPLPDLVITSLTETGFTVTNSGTDTAGPFVISVTLIGTFSFAGLKAGESATRVWSACRVGTLTAIADRGDTVTESNEGNNSRSLVSDC